jgi:CarD family transcriptional regulator
MNSGSIFEVARVLKNLFFLSFQKSLSFREKKMFDRARQLVVSEIATVQDQDLGKIETMVDKLLTTTYEQVQAQATN